MQDTFTDVSMRIDSRLKELNLKQSDLFKATNISRNAISQYVTGKRIPDTTSLYKIANALSVSMEWLLTGVTNTTNENTSNENILTCDGVPLSESEADLLAMYRLLESGAREDIYDYVLMKYEKATGERGSVYSTYSDTKEQQKSDPLDTGKDTHGIA